MAAYRRDKLLSYMLDATLILVTVLTLISLFTEIPVRFNLIEFFLGLSMFLQANLNWERHRTASILCLLCAVSLWIFTLVDYFR